MFLPSFFGVREKKKRNALKTSPNLEPRGFFPLQSKNFPTIPPQNPKNQTVFCRKFQNHLGMKTRAMPFSNIHFQGVLPWGFLSNPSISNFRRQALCARCRSTAAAPSSSASEAKARTSRKRSYCRTRRRDGRCVDFNIPGGPDPWGWYISIPTKFAI